MLTIITDRHYHIKYFEVEDVSHHQYKKKFIILHIKYLQAKNKIYLQLNVKFESDASKTTDSFEEIEKGNIDNNKLLSWTFELVFKLNAHPNFDQNKQK